MFLFTDAVLPAQAPVNGLWSPQDVFSLRCVSGIALCSSKFLFLSHSSQLILYVIKSQKFMGKQLLPQQVSLLSQHRERKPCFLSLCLYAIVTLQRKRFSFFLSIRSIQNNRLVLLQGTISWISHFIYDDPWRFHFW